MTVVKSHVRDHLEVIAHVLPILPQESFALKAAFTALLTPQHKQKPVSPFSFTETALVLH